MSFFLDQLLQGLPQAQQYFGNHFPFGYNEEAALQAALQASQREQQQTPKPPPPAAPRIIRSLPQIRISAPDLVDPVNRQCPISLEPLKLGDTDVTRLPCAHLFKTSEIMHWLQTTCTCPVCRYELPTEDPTYEPGRLQRMALRKPRFAKHELLRLSNKQLLQLLRRHNSSKNSNTSSSSYQPVDKQDLIEYLITSGAIELIHAPEPVQYSLQALRAMSVKQLKACMNEQAGVFFDPAEVVEKEDMVRIFLASGRLDVIPDDGTEDSKTENNDNHHHHHHHQQPTDKATNNNNEDEDDKPAATVVPPVVVETVTGHPDHEDSDDERNDDENENIRNHSSHSHNVLDTRTDPSLVMEEVATVDDADNVHNHSSAPDAQMHASAQAPATTVDSTARHQHSQHTEDEDHQHSSNNDTAIAADEDTSQSSSNINDILDEQRRGRKRPSPPSLNSTTVNDGNEEDADNSHHHDVGISDNNAAMDDSTDSTTNNNNANTRYHALSIRELRNMGRSMSVDMSDCIERQEMIERLSLADNNSSNNNSNDGDAVSSVGEPNNNSTTNAVLLSALSLLEWTLSDIRSIARILRVDLGGGGSGAAAGGGTFTNSIPASREGMIEQLCRHFALVHHRDPVRFCRTLIPLVRCSVTQLRAAARTQHLDLSGCLEKDDMILRLAEHQMMPHQNN